MSREATVILVGILIVISPFVGLPMSWLAWILPVLGIIAAVIGYSLRSERARRERAAHETSSVVLGTEVSIS